MSLEHPLAIAVAAAREAGGILRHDFHRAGGPRGGGDKADADHEAEERIRALLVGEFPDWGFRGEETGSAKGAIGSPVWLVDPNDGTRDYLVGRRGSAVSIGLVRDGRPVLGVVYAFCHPDDDGDLFAWAEGCGPLRRNGTPLQTVLPEALGPTDIVLVSSRGERDPEGNLRSSDPARYRSVPSIAHRLALVAAGEAAAANALLSPGDWDYGAGHALVSAVGGVVVNEDGRPVAYGPDGSSRTERCFAGSPAVAALLAARPWDVAGVWGDERPACLLPGEAIADAGLLSRAQGCLLGQLAGDNLGALVEFSTAEEIARAHADGGPRLLVDGGHWRIVAGQPTDDSEMALSLARSIVAQGTFDSEHVWSAYEAWWRSGPFDKGQTIRAALSGRPDPESQANGSLMRASPLGILAHAKAPAAAAEIARADSALTHPHPVCGDAVAAFVVGVAHAVAHGDGPERAYDAALAWARTAAARPEVVEALVNARKAPPKPAPEHLGWVLVALQNAFFQLLHAPTVEEGVVASVRRGGDTDTNAAIAGALLGAVHGRAGVPAQWRSMVLSCHPVGPRAQHPRPRTFWPVDVFEVAERLLLAGRAAAPGPIPDAAMP